MAEFENASWSQRWRFARRSMREWAQKQWVDGVWLVVPVVGSLVITGLVALMPGTFTGLDPIDVSTLPPGVTYPWRDPALATYDVRQRESIHAASDRVAFARRIAERRMARVHEILYAPVERAEVMDMDSALGVDGVFLDMDAVLDTPGALNAPAAVDPAAAQPAAPASSRALIDINTATSAELQRLPRIGPALADRIIAGRPFRGARDLLAVPGIGRATLAGFEASIRFE